MASVAAAQLAVNPVPHAATATLAPLCTLEGHTDRVWHTALHPTRDLLVTCSGDRAVRLWCPRRPGDHAEWTCTGVLEDFTARTVRCAEWSPDGRFLACASFDAQTTVWALAGGGGGGGGASGATPAQLEPVATLEGHDHEVKGVAWSPSGALLATCSRDKSVWLWSVGGGGRDDDGDFECAAVLHGHGGDVKAVRWHPTRELLLSASYDDTVKVWAESADEAEWSALQTLTGHGSTVWGLGFDGRGSGLATVSDDCTVRLWNAAPPPPGEATGVVDALLWRPAGAPVVTLHDRAVYSVDWSPPVAGPPLARDARGEAGGGAGGDDVSVIATGSADDSVGLMGPTAPGAEAPYAPVGSVAHAHASDVNCVRWHARDPGLLFTAGDDAVVRVWRLGWGGAGGYDVRGGR